MAGSVSKDSARGFRIFGCCGCLRGGGLFNSSIWNLGFVLQFRFCVSVTVVLLWPSSERTALDHKPSAQNPKQAAFDRPSCQRFPQVQRLTLLSDLECRGVCLSCLMWEYLIT